MAAARRGPLAELAEAEGQGARGMLVRAPAPVSGGLGRTKTAGWCAVDWFAAAAAIVALPIAADWSAVPRWARWVLPKHREIAWVADRFAGRHHCDGVRQDVEVVVPWLGLGPVRLGPVQRVPGLFLRRRPLQSRGSSRRYRCRIAPRI